MDRTAALAQRICKRAQHLPETSLRELERYVEFLQIRAEASESGNEQIVFLEQLANTRDYQRFAILVRGIDWLSRPVEELGKAIDLAVSLHMVVIARELVELGLRLHPTDAHIRQAHDVLAPPLAQSKRLPYTQGLDASKKWLREHTSEYRGQWVAVHNGELVGVGSTLDELRSGISEDRDSASTLLTKVP